MKSVLAKSALIASLVLGSVFAAPVSAQSQNYVRVQWDSPVFAGPGYEFPQVATIPGNQTVRLYGCLHEIAWCDVGYGYARGWIDADNLLVYRGTEYYPFYQSRSWFYYPVISFILGDYWWRHYRASPWYGDRYRYHNRDWRHDSRNWNDHRRNDNRDDWRRSHDNYNRNPDNRFEAGSRRPTWRDYNGQIRERPTYNRQETRSGYGQPPRATAPQPRVNPQVQPHIPRQPVDRPHSINRPMDREDRSEARFQRPVITTPTPAPPAIQSIPPVDQPSSQPPRQERIYQHRVIRKGQDAERGTRDVEP